MASCTSVLAANVLSDCDNLPTSGCDETLYIINKDDISSWTVASGIITGVTLKASKYIYKIEGYNRSLDAGHTMVASGFTSGYQHYIEFLMPQNNQASKDQAMALKDGRFVCIIKRNTADGLGDFEVYGRALGMSVVNHEAQVNNEETGGNIQIRLQTVEGEREPKVPQQYLDTDAENTQTEITGLVAA